MRRVRVLATEVSKPPARGEPTERVTPPHFRPQPPPFGVHRSGRSHPLFAGIVVWQGVNRPGFSKDPRWEGDAESCRPTDGKPRRMQPISYCTWLGGELQVADNFLSLSLVLRFRNQPLAS